MISAPIAFFLFLVTKPRLLILVTVCLIIIFIGHPTLQGTQQAIDEQRPKATHYADVAGDYIEKTSKSISKKLGWD